MNASNVESVANQLAGIRAQVLALANTSYQGQYIFGGGQSTVTPFTLSSATSPATTSYNGDQGVNYLHTPNGQTIQLNVPGDQIFAAAGANGVFAALNSLIADYSSGTVNSAQAVSDTQALGTALNFVSQQRVTIDNSLTQLTAASDAVSSEKVQLTASQTNLMQADVAQVATQLSLAETQQTALEDVISQLGSGSLFNKLQ
jgi:flagellar hook-associated protein 3 FlgL